MPRPHWRGSVFHNHACVRKAHEGALNYNVMNTESPTPYCVTQDTLFGLMLDVDGPISSPVTRTISQPGLIEALVTLANCNVPIVFNTGRSDDFLEQNVAAPLYEAGLSPDALVWGVGEKGAAWYRFGNHENLAIDPQLSVPSELGNRLKAIAERDFADLVFFDDTKRTMVSLEQRLELPSEDFLARRPLLDAALAAATLDAGYDISWHGNVSDELRALATDPRASTGTNIRIDSSIIATDVEHCDTGKNVGAKRFIDELLAHGVTPPQRWFTMGDSAGDYAMSQWLHDNAFTVSHVDVRPAASMDETEYPVLMHPLYTFDQAGEFFLSAWARKIAA